MGIILIGILMLVVGYLLLRFAQHEFLEELIGPILIIMSIILMFCSFFAIAITNLDKEACTESNKKVYDSLLYQVKSHMYNNDNEVGKKELVDQVTEWNSNLSANRAHHNSFWLNMFYPVDYDQFEYIPIELIK